MRKTLKGPSEPVPPPHGIVDVASTTARTASVFTGSRLSGFGCSRFLRPPRLRVVLPRILLAVEIAVSSRSIGLYSHLVASTSSRPGWTAIFRGPRPHLIESICFARFGRQIGLGRRALLCCPIQRLVRFDAFVYRSWGTEDGRADKGALVQGVETRCRLERQ